MTGSLIAVLVAFAISLISGKFLIPALHRLKVGQTVRDDGPQTHLKKNGTPTMGGVIFLLAFTVTSLFFVKESPYILPIVLLTLGFGAIGFIDDFIKVVLKRSMGLRAWQKMLGQFVICGIFAWYMMTKSGIDLVMLIPFSGGAMWNPEIMAVPIMFFVILGTVNGTNFTDGLDGLASGVTVVVAIFFAAVSVRMGVAITPAMMAMVGALLGFLCYNSHPASVFMGDTGSLALGGLVAGAAYVLQMPLFIVLVGFIYLIEVLSVILQVSYFKLTHGKRIFKMAPIHHHFEKCGYAETKVVNGFTIVTILLCIVAWMAI